MMVLDVLRYDIEQISNMLTILNNRGCIGWRDVWPHDFTRDEVIPALRELLDRQMVDVYVWSSDQSELEPRLNPSLDFERSPDDCWFLLTDAGRPEWERWDDPPVTDV